MPRLLFLLSALLLLAGACAQQEHVTSRDIIAKIPWTAPETDSYRVLDGNGKEVGAAQLKIEKNGANLRLTQHYDYPGSGYVNDSVVIVDPTGLQPVSTNYTLNGPNGNVTCEGHFSAGQVAAHRVGQDGERNDTLDIPAIAYDSWSDLFLWRTIDFSQGFGTDYADILSCTLDKTQKIGVTLNVKAEEQVTVPAGAYDTWRLEIDSGGSTQKAWYTTDAAHTLVKYDNGNQTFELTKAGG
jgi:Protein of unknown function (DUF3108)